MFVGDNFQNYQYNLKNDSKLMETVPIPIWAIFYVDAINLKGGGQQNTFKKYDFYATEGLKILNFAS